MKNFAKSLLAAAAAVAVMVPGAASAASAAATALGQCLYDNSSAADKDKMIQWAYVTIGKSQAARQVQTISDAKTKEVTAATKTALTNLVISKCPKETAQVLFTDPKNGAADAMEELTALMLRDKVRSKIGEVLNISAGNGSAAGNTAAAAANVLQGLGSLISRK